VPVARQPASGDVRIVIRSRLKGYRKAFFFFGKEAKNFCSIGFGLSAEAQPEFVKVFWFFFSKKNRLLGRLPSMEAISIPGQLRKKKHKLLSFWLRPLQVRLSPDRKIF
jgi:hypothetical protein